MEKFNPNHGRDGRFTFGEAGVAPSIFGDRVTRATGVTKDDDPSATAWLRTHASPQLTERERAAISLYMETGNSINGQLITGGDDAPARTLAIAKALDGAIDKSTVGESITVYRVGYLGNAPADKHAFSIGQTVQQRGFVSTSLRADDANGYTAYAHDMLAIEVPRGAHAVAGLAAHSEGFDPHHELILPRGSRFEVTGFGRMTAPHHEEIGDTGKTHLVQDRRVVKLRLVLDAKKVQKFNPNHDEKGRFTFGEHIVTAEGTDQLALRQTGRYDKFSEAARQSGYPEDKFILDRQQRQFVINGEKLLEAGHFDPSTGEITLNPSMINDGDIPGVVAHEVEHAKLDAFLDAAQDRESPESKILDHLNPNTLARYDGFTGYSRDVWNKAYMTREGADLISAIHETLAEVARVLAKDGTLPGLDDRNPWKSLYEEVEKHWTSRGARTKQKHRTAKGTH